MTSRGSHFFTVGMLVLLVLVTSALTAQADQFTFVTATELKSMLDEQASPLVIIDSRSAAEFQEAHIRDAVNIPLTVQEGSPQALPFKKTSKIVFYCNGFS